MTTRSPLRAKKEALFMRARIFTQIRRFFAKEGYLEVTTPIRIPTPIPEAYIDAIDTDGWVLQTSPELCMKRMAADGYERIYQICPCFRKGERGQHHLTEFTMLEWYQAGLEYQGLMDQTETLIKFLVKAVLKDDDPIKDRFYNNIPWKRITVSQAFNKYARISLKEALIQNRFDEVMAFEIEPGLDENGPTFLYDYPVSQGALAKTKRGDPKIAERFELYIDGLEICNGFTELTNPYEQRRRFERENLKREEEGKVTRPLPERLLQCMGNMPPTAGNALGLDRLTMLLTKTRSIDEVVAFTPEEL